MGQDTDIIAQQAHYDRRWTKVGNDYANLLQLGRAIAVLEGLWLVNRRRPEILDLGCGNGWLTSILGRFGPTTGVDLSPVGIQKGKERFPGIEFIAGNVFDLDLKPESFDVVVSCQVLEHMEDQRAFLRLAAGLLKADGYLIIVTTNPWNLSHWDQEELVAFAGGLQPLENWLTARQLATLLNERFRVRRLRTLLPGYGNRGILRLLHSPKLFRGLRAIGLLEVYQKILLRFGCGLLLCAVAERRR